MVPEDMIIVENANDDVDENGDNDGVDDNVDLAGNVDTLPTEIGEPGLGDGGR